MSDFWKNRKVVVYIALPHHTRFLTPLAEIMDKQGAQVCYVVGQAERSQEITAIILGLSYTHIFDYVTTQKDQEYVKKEYDRLVSTFGNSLKNSFLFGVSPVTVVDKTLYSTAMEYVGFKNLMQRERPDICLALHELNRWGKMLGFWAKKYNVPMVTFQEGMYYGMDYGYMGHVQYSTLDLVWGDRLKNKLVGFEAPADKILPTGNIHLANELLLQKKKNMRERKRKAFRYRKTDLVFLLLISGNIPIPEKLFPVMESICNNSSRHLIIKFHPITIWNHVLSWKNSVPDHLKTRVQILQNEESVYDLLSVCDVCVLVQPSTTGIEALAFGKPLIHLTGTLMIDDSDFFIQRQAAVPMTPVQLAEKIERCTDFTTLMSAPHVQACLADELSNTASAVDRARVICELLVQANQAEMLPEISLPKKPNRPWTIILSLSESSAGLLGQLETLAENSESQGNYQVIFVEPANLSRNAKNILDSLQGDVVRIVSEDSAELVHTLNLAAENSEGEYLIFLKPGLTPFPQWLAHFGDGVACHGQNRVFGARILDERGSLVHGGIMIDTNNAPVPAYAHLEPEFFAAMKERSFQMLDYCLCVPRSLFARLGGFSDQAGKFAFMDLCLRINEKEGEGSCIYLPKVCLMAAEDSSDKFDPKASAYFYGRWHGCLWENQTSLYMEDNITPGQVDTARMSRAASIQ